MSSVKCSRASPSHGLAILYDGCVNIQIRPAVASFVPMISSPENLLPTMTERILGWADVECSTPIIANVIEAVSNQEERQFVRWCQGSECNPALHAIDKRCASLLYLSLKLTMHSAEHLTSLQVAAQSGVYQHWRLWVNTRFCASHKSLNNFVARFDSDAWESMYPPNGWVCGCGVTVVDSKDPLVAASTNGVLSAEMKRRCTSWIDRKPLRQWLMLR